MDLSKDIELLNRREKKEKNGNEESIKNGAGSDLSDTEDKSKSNLLSFLLIYRFKK